jgi:Bacterial transcriptional activator domain
VAEAGDARLVSGEHRAVAAEAEVLVEQEPLRERRWAILALAQYRSGRQADALRSLHRARSTLADQLGIDPGPELVALEAAILRQDPSLVAVAEPPAITDDCPYKGLGAYDEADIDSFFGRDVDVAACLARLEGGRRRCGMRRSGTWSRWSRVRRRSRADPGGEPVTPDLW